MMKRLFSALVLLVALVGSIATFSGAATYDQPARMLVDGVGTGISTNWAGYAVETNLQNPQSNAVTSVQGQWVVPSVSRSVTNTYSATWIGIDGLSSKSVEQIGTEHDFVQGQPVYAAWFELFPNAPVGIDMQVRPGDLMSATVRYAGNGQFLLALTDLTTGKSFTTTQSANAERSSAEWIVEAPFNGTTLPLAKFGQEQFQNAKATINGQVGTINSPGRSFEVITMEKRNGTIKAVTSGLKNDGSSFSVTRKHK